MFFVFVIISIRECHSWCRANRVPENSFGCYYEGNFIRKGETISFFPQCVKCRCSKTTLECCSIGIEITSVGPECKIVQDDCTQRAVLKSDSNKECSSVMGAIGRHNGSRTSGQHRLGQGSSNNKEYRNSFVLRTVQGWNLLLVGTVASVTIDANTASSKVDQTMRHTYTPSS
ncbi:unnamed protein product [Mytilus coruscus]|uniref:Uncharacterized protein n=1 Tax=Mytilus coruscus TaxID=42192 RepID=A0A6J8E0N2_MYTCO|nr:unnamed protein product [Mytilus coruscus]